VKSTFIAVLAVSAAVFCATSSPSPVVAQPELQKTAGEDVLGEMAAGEVGERAAELLRLINEDFKKAAFYREKMAAASPEDSIVLRLQFTALRLRFMENVHQLADALIEREQEGPQPELRRRVDKAYVLVMPQIWEFIERYRREIDSLRARRLSTPPEGRSELEDRIAKITADLNEVYQLAQDHIVKMDELELDTAEEKEQFKAALLDRADELSGRLALDMERIKELEARAKETSDDANVKLLLVATQKSLDNNAASLEIICDLMDLYGLDPADYRAQLMIATSDITAGITDAGAAKSLLKQGWENFLVWIADKGPAFAVKLLLFFGILAVFYFLTRVMRKAVDTTLRSSKLTVSRLLRRMIVSTVANLTMFFGLLIALSQLGISLGPLLAGLGVAGFIIGFALQDTLANFASGMMILLYRPYDVGDLVDVGGVFGKVDKMSLVSTTVLTIDNQTMVVPNKKIWGDVIKNVTAQDIRRVDMLFGISYSDDIPKAEKVLADILEHHDKILEEPAPMVHLHELGDSSVNFVVRPWVKVADYWDVYWYVTRAVKMRFDEEGISIPFPQRDVHIYEERLAGRGGGDAAERDV
jgi:small conductance mechanosensitive channel